MRTVRNCACPPCHPSLTRSKRACPGAAREAQHVQEMSTHSTSSSLVRPFLIPLGSKERNEFNSKSSTVQSYAIDRHGTDIMDMWNVREKSGSREWPKLTKTVCFDQFYKMKEGIWLKHIFFACHCTNLFELANF